MMAPAQLVGNVKEFLILDFPFVFANEKEADFVLDGPLGKKLLDKLPEKNLVGLAYMEQGFRSISNSKHPVVKLEDIQGLKLRTIQNPLYIDLLNALGANAVPMPFTELYTALETKTVDGQENPYPTVEASKLYEVQNTSAPPNISITRNSCWSARSSGIRFRPMKSRCSRTPPPRHATTSARSPAK